jgi:hypothetical protein
MIDLKDIPVARGRRPAIRLEDIHRQSDVNPGLWISGKGRPACGGSCKPVIIRRPFATGEL